jgi:hypothetical protein
MNRIHPLLDDWLILIEKHITQRPLMKPSDVYKLLYQGILGPEHLIASESAFAKRLQAEFETLPDDLEEPLFENLHPHKTLLRINLKPYKTAAYDFAQLLDACLQTARRKWGTPEELRSLWESLCNSYNQHKFAVFSTNEMDEFTAWLASHDYPAVHHSTAYRQAYQPAYRLVASDLAAHWK